MNITLIDPSKISDPEILAMLMAFYSRSTKPIHERLESLGENEVQIKNALKKYYVGYGHESIADCSSVSIFFEGISLLAAKEIEASPLFNGQECSTRYIEFDKQGFVDPFDTTQSNSIQTRWLELYQSLQEPIKQELEKLNPKKLNQSEEVWQRAIKAKVLDITRAFLPIGMKTSVAAHMSMRALNQHLHILKNSKVVEVVELAKTSLQQLKDRFPFVFSKEYSDDVETFKSESSYLNHYYLKTPSTKYMQPLAIDNTISSEIYNFAELLFSRPKGTELPSFLSSLGTVSISYSLDYGSWRDIQRHRNTVYNQSTLVSDTRTFYMEYLKHIPSELKTWVLHEINEQYRDIENLYNKFLDLSNLQYYLPLGNVVNAKLILTIPQLVYILELRSSQSVHFTLRQLILSIATLLKPKYPMLLQHVDVSPTEFFLNRGAQTIVQKN